MTALDRHYRVLRKPVVTEKSSGDMAERNAYHFRVPVDANKVEIRQAVEALFEVKVESVNTLHVRGKTRRRGYVAGKKPDWKKAMVKLADGQSIDVI
ncbi:50S ribosomal protein L23 [Engelhardtia mirabilis]|uniref:Large ribosomal subunit protein uL23 n=1 Tax=Engelhardtia mirabilis TaxID=2528011 RepID=A0A518BPD6_9BACT|nr:50S ribosomal protein L23 [Planctomycetes bacterium Pla133]QDV03164.1 50S ribosomal protein L23 [Planctomycetes bacterium Pla86]